MNLQVTLDLPQEFVVKWCSDRIAPNFITFVALVIEQLNHGKLSETLHDSDL